ncbi:arsenate reductase ArsC [Agrococcus sp. Marseille-Q4369]|uniref:arsenate reductase/protein-tyrosine-phosphatase family protein n=1 Tax=Agrococcus sp. Marseille-Q4369 TaxID=2810513 RepID=UPI001B8D3677|nr:arsenate reductase ArsC [Agrococcus sp. Marseille-Q4369]QUW18735.1 arsenate reductase ArsC [Agrococcus sp. Marseille-Q4369]
MAEFDVRGRRGLPGIDYPERFLHALTDELSAAYQGIFAAETIERYVLESYAALLRTSVVKAHLVARVTRFAKDRLRALAEAKGAIPQDRPSVLFVCVQNAGRSQMAAAIAAERSEGGLVVRSAGSMPAASLNPAVVSAMAEVGLDLTAEFPKPLTDDVVRAADVVVTMGCGDACPIYPGKHYEDWQLTDPEHATPDDVRRIRDEIIDHVDRMLEQLGVAPA